METIYKKISIEPFKKRIVKKHTNNNAAKVEYYPSFEQGNNRIAYDIKVEDDTVSPFLILDIKNNEKVLRYSAWSPWSRMFKRSIQEENNIRFEELPFSNDMMFFSPST